MGSDGGREGPEGRSEERDWNMSIDLNAAHSVVLCRVYSPLHRMAIAVKEEDYGQERGTEAQNREAEKQLTEK